MSEIYHYSPLPSPNSIRLLQIKPGNGPFVCSLKITDIKWPEYFALSYTWGNPDEESPKTHPNETPGLEKQYHIICDGKRINITQNCHEALERLREFEDDVETAEEVSLLWVDAICIDQSNMDEKGTQVEMMGTIFAKAAGVIIWLGKLTQEIGEAVDIIWKFGEAVTRLHPGLGIDELAAYQFNDPTLMEAMGMQPLTLRQWRLVLDFLKKRWFTRGWIVQEFVLAQEAFVFSEPPRDLVHLLAFVAFISRSGWGSGLAYIAKHSSPSSQTYFQLLADSFPLRLSRILGPEDPASLAELRTLYGAKTRQDRQLAYLEHVLTRCRNYDVTDPKDKVFAPLALATYYRSREHAEASWLVPNYHLSTEQIYFEISCLLLSKSRRLSLLCQAGDHSRTRMSGLPSWVPDFSVPLLTAPLFHMKDCEVFGSFCYTEYPAKVLTESSLLQLRGIIFDSVSVLTDTTESILARHELTIWWNVIMHVPLNTRGETPLEMLWRTLIANWGTRETEATQELEKSFFNLVLQEMVTDYWSTWKATLDSASYWLAKTIYLQLREFEPDLPARDEFIQACIAWDRAVTEKAVTAPEEFHDAKKWLILAVQASGQRRLLATLNGNLGLGPQSSHIGDVVAFIHGSKVPFILRPITSNRYRLVGEAYLHGYMNGEICQRGLPDLEDIILK